MTKNKLDKPTPVALAMLATVRGGFVTAEITMAKVLTPEQIAGTDDESAALVVDNGSGMC